MICKASIIFQQLHIFGCGNFFQGLSLDLANALARNAKLLPHLFKGAAAAILKPESQAEHPLLAWGKSGKHLFDLLLEQLF